MGSWTRNYWQNAEAVELTASDLTSSARFGQLLTTVRAPSDLQGQSAIVVNQGPQFLGDDIADNTSTTTSISVGGSLSSAIQSAGDVDYIRINLVAGQTYTFSLSGLSDSYVELRNSAGALVAENDDGGLGYDSLLMYNATASGTFYLVARHYSAVVDANYPVVTGNYTLSVGTVPAGETSPSTFPSNSLPHFSWDEAAIQIANDSWSQSYGASAVVTYSFRSTAPAQMPDDTTGFNRFSAAQIAAAEAALAAWASVANITFVRVNDGDGYSNNAAIVFGNYASGAAGAAAFAFTPTTGNQSASSIQGDIWINSSLDYNGNPVRGQYGQQVLLHEIGHALGLDHPGDYNAEEGVSITYGANAEYFGDTRMFTVMSYFSGAFTGANTPLYASLPQLHDIAAIQRLYGANITTRTGDTIYGFNSNTGVPEYTIALASQNAIFTVWDGGGIDTLDFSGYTNNNNLIDLRQEAFSNLGLSTANVSIARGVVIENAIGGSGNDTIIGNAANNTLTGGAGADSISGNGGNDTIFGGLGADTLNGGDGDDTLDGGADADTVNGGDGNDTIFWDAADGMTNATGGAGSDILVFTSGNAPTAFNLVAQGFEGAHGRFAVTGATFIDYYDAQWRLSEERGQATNGASWYIDYDETSTLPYQVLNQDFDTSGNLAHEHGLADNGSTWDQYFDTDGTHPYVYILQVHTANGTYANEHGVSDNGSTWDTFYDVDGTNPFQWIQQVRDANGVLAQEEGLADSGTRWFTDYDETGTTDYVFYQNVYDTLNRLSFQSGQYDTGYTWTIDYDETNTQPWTSIRNDYDDHGVLIGTTTIYD